MSVAASDRTGLLAGHIKISAFSLLVNGFSQSSSSNCRQRPPAVGLNSSDSSSSSSSESSSDNGSVNAGHHSRASRSAASLVETQKPKKRPNLHLQLPCVARPAKVSNGHITMATEDLLQPGHVVKERWKVVSSHSKRFLFVCCSNLAQFLYDWLISCSLAWLILCVKKSGHRRQWVVIPISPSAFFFYFLLCSCSALLAHVSIAAIAHVNSFLHFCDGSS